MAGLDPRSSTNSAPLHQLPLELRHQIYAYLLPCENVSHPIPSVGISSVSHRPPTSALLHIHPTMTDEMLDYFYTISTWKLVFSHAFNFFRVDPELRRLEQCPSLAYIRKVELVFFCDVLLLQSYPSFGVESFWAEIRKRASRACDVLNLAPKLRTVVVSWYDSTSTGTWQEKANILTPLRKLVDAEGRKTPVRFRVGKITGPEHLNRTAFVATLREVLGVEQKLDCGNDGTEDASQNLGVLAFDTRQDRHQLSPKAGSFPLAGTTRRGWKGAPPLMAAPAEEDAEVETDERPSITALETSGGIPVSESNH